MKLKSRSASAAIAGSLTAVALVTMTINATPASAEAEARFRHAANKLSLRFKVPGFNCYYKIRFGNFGNVAYSQVRGYSAGCGSPGSVLVSVAASSSPTTGGVWQSNTISALGSDDCGGYAEVQAQSPPNHIAVGMAVRFTELGYTAGFSTYNTSLPNPHPC